MKFFLAIFLVISIINRISAFENCGPSYQDPKLKLVHDYILKYYPFDQISVLAQEYLPEALVIDSFVRNFSNSLAADPKFNHALEYICEKTHFDIFGWLKVLWSKFRKEYFQFITIKYLINFASQMLIRQ
jgi:hypothetical protein